MSYKLETADRHQAEAQGIHLPVVHMASAERAGQGEVGGCTQRVQTAWPRLGSALNSSWLEPGIGHFFIFLA